MGHVLVVVIAVVIVFFIFKATFGGGGSSTPPAPEVLEFPGLPDGKASMVTLCQEQISAQLKAPSTAVFQNADFDQITPISSGLLWVSYVDAENSFGAELRNMFICHYTKATQEVKAAISN